MQNGHGIQRILDLVPSNTLWFCFYLPYLLPIHKGFVCTISALCSKNNPRNINYMPVVIFFVRLDLEQKTSYINRHHLVVSLKFMHEIWTLNPFSPWFVFNITILNMDSFFKGKKLPFSGIDVLYNFHMSAFQFGEHIKRTYYGKNISRWW